MPQSKQLTIEQAISWAISATKQGDTATALQLYNAVLQRQPNHPVAKEGLSNLQKGLPGNQSVQTQMQNHSPDPINALINLYQTGQMVKTEKSCREFLKTNPQSEIITNLLGGALQGQGKLQEAVQVFDTAIDLNPEFADAYYNRGNTLKDLGQLKAAVESYGKAVELNPEFAEAYNNRGNILRDLGQLKAAVESYEKVVELKPNYALAHRHLSCLKKYKPADVQIETMERLLTYTKPSASDRMNFCFALAKAYEDLGEYDKSFNYLGEGNQLRQKELNYNFDNDRKIFAKIREIFTAESLKLENVPDEAASIQPIFIVGMPRSGTSLVEQVLASHTKVHGAGELEIMSRLVTPILNIKVSQDTNKLSQNVINTMHESYIETLTVLNVPEKVITDKTPLNFRWIGLILTAFPKAKIINLNRDARATCWSIYKHYFSVQGHGYAYDMDDLVEFYKLYIDLMSFWRERYPKSIYDLCYEDLTENQEQETRRLLEFCDLEWEEQCLDFHKTERAVKTVSAVQVRKKMYKGSSEAWRKYEKYLQSLINSLGY